MSSTAIPRVVPAQLSFLAIYNPTLGATDETFHNQIVFYHSKAAKVRSKIEGKNAQAEDELREQENEKLRQVGLAQGMVGFARSFSNGAAVDSVETAKSRIVLHELEQDWWILASINLTQLPAHQPSSVTGNGPSTPADAVEYSSREVSPPALLLKQLVRAHNIFLLHHGQQLGNLFQKLHRAKFTSILDRYWSRFASSWDVLLHGSPVVDMYGGTKLSAGGELGMGVGEEEWGSGERLVLEDFVQKTEGLVDLFVSRFGEPSPLQDLDKHTNTKESIKIAETEPWIGSGRSPEPQDGVVFSGVGAITRKSLRDLSHWIESIYCHGDHAYGVRDNPTTLRTKRRRRRSPNPSKTSADSSAYPENDEIASSTDAGVPPGIPPPIVKAVESSLDKASNAVISARGGEAAQPSQPLLPSLADTETWVKFMTLGYGTAWGAQKPGTEDLTPTQERPGVITLSPEVPMRFVEPQPDVDHVAVKAERLKSQIEQENAGYFVIGLKGDMEEQDVDDENDDGDWNNRTVLRNVYVELNKEKAPEARGADGEPTPSFEDILSFSSATSGMPSLRPVVYAHRPFIYTFLFAHRTEALTLATFYRNLHTYFSPLHRPLSNSTSPSKVAARVSAAYSPYTTESSNQGAEPNVQPIYDVAYDPRTMTVHSSIPNIPEPGTLIAEGLSSATNAPHFSRLEALNVHSQILATIISTHRTLSEIERTCKTNRGWWVVWMRLPPSQIEPTEDGEPETEDFDTDQLREAFLVRRARDAAGPQAKSSGGRFGSAMWGPSKEKTGGAAAGWGPKGLGEGIGIDARRYVEGLLSLNR